MKSTISLFTLTAFVLITFAGCALQPTVVQPPAVETRVVIEPAPKSASEQLLNFLLEARAMPASDLSNEKDRARAEFAKNKTEFNRMKLAILIALSSAINQIVQPAATNTADDNELAALLEPLTYSVNASGSAAAPDLRGLAMLIQSLVQDRKKLRDQLKDALTRTQTTRRDELSSQSEARILRAKVEELEKKLDALKSIERSVSVKGDARNNTAPPTRSDGAPK